MNLSEMLEQYRDMKAELAPAMESLNRLEREIKAHVLDTGETAKVVGAEVKIRNGYTRTSWDGKLLAAYAKTNPEVLNFQKVSEVAPTAVLKVII